MIYIRGFLIIFSRKLHKVFWPDADKDPTIGHLGLFCSGFLSVNGTVCSRIDNLGPFCFRVYISVNGTYCSQIGDFGTDFGPFCFALIFWSQIKVSFLNKAKNRARTDLLGQVWLHLTVMNFEQ